MYGVSIDRNEDPSDPSAGNAETWAKNNKQNPHAPLTIEENGPPLHSMIGSKPFNFLKRWV